MKKLISLAFALLASQSFAGDKINNGGGLWACVAGEAVQTAYLVDLYEARKEFGLVNMVPTSTNVMTLVEERATFLRLNFPVLSAELMPALHLVIEKTRYVDAKLVPIDDMLHRLAPSDSECPQGKWEYVQFADYAEYSPGMSQVLIRRDLWENPVVSALDKSALIWHEAIYKWLRTKYGDANSVRARMLVGILFAQLSYEEVKSRFDAVLSTPVDPEPKPKPIPQTQWMCMIKNNHQSKYYSGYGATQKAARFKAMETCQSNSSGIFCTEEELTCDSFDSNVPQWSCELKNNHTRKSFFASGRSRLEAEFNVRTSCGNAGNGFFCKDEVSCERQ